jgi:hypothetical protein
MWLKLAKIKIFDFFAKSNFLNVIILKLSVFHDLKNVKIAENILKICQFFAVLANLKATFYEFKTRFEKS